MTELSGTSAAGSRTAVQERRWATAVKVPLACLVIAGASLSATLCSFGAPSGADQISSLQAQAAQLSSAMLLEQLQIGGYQQQYRAAIDRVHQDVQLVEQARTSIEHDQRQIARDTEELRAAAVADYEHGDATAGTTPLFADQRSEGTRSEYQHILTGTVSDAVDQLRSDRSSLRLHEASLQRVQAQDQATQADAQSLLQESQSTQQQLQQQSARVDGALATAVAQQEADQAAAAAAAVAAAQAKAVAAQRAEVEVGDQAPASPSTASPALNPFLQCVAQEESNGDYQAVSPNGEYRGAFQFGQATWNQAALLAGQPSLVGVPPNEATPAEQDDLAVALYNADGRTPWYDPCTAT